MARVVVRIARSAGIIALFLMVAILGVASGVIFAYTDDVAKISELDDYTPSTISRIYGSGGEIVGEFAIQRREVIPYEAISPRLRQAILAAEDDTFEKHPGISIPHIAVTLVKDILKRKKAGGASTLTQQLARKLFLTDEKTWERKIREALLAIRIEKRYTKREIFTMYANQMYFGHGVYGVEAASRLYFGKSAKDVELEEAAMIAGILQGNVRQSPFVNMDAAIRRRNYTLGRMAEVGYISPAEAEASKKKPIVLRGEPSSHASIAPYFVEDIRKQLEQQYGAKQLYENGLSIHTGLNLRLQAAVNRALDDGLRRIDKVRGWRAPRRNIVAEGHQVEAFRQARWDRPMHENQVVPAVVTAADATTIRARAGALQVSIDRKGFAWTRKTAATQLVKVGDLIEVRLEGIDDAAKTANGVLEQPPAVEGAILAIDNRTGQIRAMSGGWSFERSKFNRATQAYRQVGSSFKPIVYTAAIDRGYTPASVLMDSPVSFPGGAGQPVYSPMNYDRKFEGGVTLRRALEQSRNVPAVRMMDQLGPKQVIMFARRLGLESPLPPYLPVALGAAEATLMEMTSAYAVFPNQGVRMKPIMVLKVTDREGNVLEENRPEPKDAIRADTAFVMTNLLRGVVQRGTAAKANALNWPMGGKTGTTDDYTDAWFIGFDPDITVGVWVGMDQKKPIGHNQTGSDAALPIWMDVMKAWIGDRKEPPQFEAPGNIVFALTEQGVNEAFIAGTQPGSMKDKQ